MTQNRRSNADGDDSLRARVLDLRERGWSNPDIRAELGLSGWKLTQLLQGHVEPAHANLANRARTELRAQARDLREQGWSYDATARRLRVSKSSLSVWLRDLPKPETYHPGEPPEGSGMTPQEWAEHCAHRQERYRRRKAEERRAQVVEAAKEIGELTDRELLIAGAIAYWCEGSKSKPWRRQGEVVFVNSDPHLVRMFLRFLELCGWSRDEVTFRLSIHENADVEDATRFWSEVVGVPPERFRRPTLKKHNPRTVRKKTGDHYHGSLVLYAQKSSRLYRRFEGWARAVMQGTEEAVTEIENTEEPPW
ncbi:helix-turn-helix domain-containing protein [Thermobifida halotolerans]|uniref:Helix-turn-helix domain-containing protein n=1 Tax=Thermobifida halotolerans TaxID=483545 RepID=A0A399G2B1_9ACTN|nr:helix-turn-helix domain-containing protein [Thermobifida halotolerans]UOE19500.1 helix-turn-helix domain-containing protein [Thermobifida halotolerans]